MPTAVLMVFSGTSLELARHHEADDGHEDERRRGRQRRQAQPVLGRPQADHDEHHLGAFEEHALEGDCEAHAVTPRVRRSLDNGRWCRPSRPPRSTPPRSRRRSCPRRGGPCGRSLAGSPCAATTSRGRAGASPHDDAQGVERDVADQGDADHDHQHPEHQRRHRRALQSRAPATADAGCHHDGEGLDHLHEAGPEDGEDEDDGGGGGMHQRPAQKYPARAPSPVIEAWR